MVTKKKVKKAVKQVKAKTKAAKTAAKPKTATSTARRAKPRPFVKMQALGNDQIILDCLKTAVSNPAHTARKLCNRRMGIGADQLVMLLKSRKADFAVR
ncbi:MAG: hypothetical protein GWN33_12950, partial [Gammaproteobacteria bacterium]|nr:hypothetical protein [Gammaproteobacteria bacterium]